VRKQQKKMGRPRTTGRGLLLGVRVHSNFLKALDEWRAKEGSKISRPEAVRQLAWLALLDRGAAHADNF
jgi:hypothetical protein